MAHFKQNFTISNIGEFKIKMLNWANRFSIFCWLDSHHYQDDKSSYPILLAAGCKRKFIPPTPGDWQYLRDEYEKNRTWWFGHMAFEMHDIYFASGQPPPLVDFGYCFFFEPEHILMLTANELVISGIKENAEKIFNQINSEDAELPKVNMHAIHASPRFHRETYMHIIGQLQAHIKRGDCYEINFCQQFSAGGVSLNPIELYRQLGEISPNPFSALYKLEDKFCMCESPERFLRKTGNNIFSQPIKGTARRYINDEEKDQLSITQMQESAKEKSENVMIVDLVRNDLSKVCDEGSVKVEELFGVYSFPAVHHMISTISGKLKDNLHWTDAVKACFPMGSMTGAPKRRVLELISRYEQSSRGLFSGSIGYINPDGDFDFNVIIRSIFYDKPAGNLSFWAGSGITFYSKAEDEYEECMLKAAAMQQVLNG